MGETELISIGQELIRKLTLGKCRDIPFDLVMKYDKIIKLPVVPHKVVAEVSIIGNL